jgi:aerobic-type carbon monoxide dehydrogenase small subunit (CoxS/CutS family)
MLTGHLCRCTGYTNIVDAVMDTAQRNEHQKEEV